MFWELAPEDVNGKPTDLSCANVEREWKRRKHKTEKASRSSWTENENSPRAMQLREYTLREFWEVFVDDRQFGAYAFFRHVRRWCGWDEVLRGFCGCTCWCAV